MTPPRTFKDITTPREMPQNRYIRSLRHLRTASSLKSAPYSTREPKRAPVRCQQNVTASSYRHIFKMKVVPKRVRQHIAQIKKTGIVEEN